MSKRPKIKVLDRQFALLDLFLSDQDSWSLAQLTRASGLPKSTVHRPIAVHALEHLGSTDGGVAMWRRLLRSAARGEIDVTRPSRRGPTATHSTPIRMTRCLPFPNAPTRTPICSRPSAATCLAPLCPEMS